VSHFAFGLQQSVRHTGPISLLGSRTKKLGFSVHPIKSGSVVIAVVDVDVFASVVFTLAELAVEPSVELAVELLEFAKFEAMFAC
jgi:hypothetical protein